MILGRGTTDTGEESLLIGLSHKNLDYLRAGRPMVLTNEKYAAIPGNMHIVIFADETEDSMTAMLRDAGMDFGEADVRTDASLGSEDGSS